MTLTLTEEQRQMVLMALAKLLAERPGWDVAIREISSKIDNRPPYSMLDSFLELNK